MTPPDLSTPAAAAFGTWTSPITPQVIVADTVSLDQVAIDGDDIYWIEGRAREQGRCVLVRYRDGQAADVTAAPWNVRSRVHEYGGGAFLVDHGTLTWTNFIDQRLYHLSAATTASATRNDGAAPKSVAPVAPAATIAPVALTIDAQRRHADAVMDRRHQRIVAVCEDHSDPRCEAQSSIVAVALNGSGEQTLVAGSDFHAAPRLNADGSRLAWLSWNHPDMPWDGCTLWQAEIGVDGTPGAPTAVAGNRQESICQPSWSPSGELYFVSDRSGWWNLYRLRHGSIEALQPMAAEFGRAHWNFGVSTYGFEADGNIICSYVSNGTWNLARLDARSLVLTPIALPFRSISDLEVGNGFAVFIGGAPDTPNSIVRLDLSTLAWTVLQRAVQLDIDPGYLSIPEALEFPTSGQRTAHAFFYAPRNRDFCGLAGQRPPLLVISHGGPTSSASATLNLAIQFWTSRGFAVLDVNYGGSTGYGRQYRERLNGQWGVVDVDDAIAAARHVVQRGDADEQKLAIRGSSAGGYTTLAALTFHDYFKAGASYYGVSDLEALARECHKFESRYLDHLVGAYPQEMALYRSRSPIHHVARLNVPLILFQGLDDKVVPPNQSQAMFDSLNQKGLPVAYITFAGEQHGFRRAENIQHALQAELYFYGRVFGFAAAAPQGGIQIMNLPEN